MYADLFSLDASLDLDDSLPPFVLRVSCGGVLISIQVPYLDDIGILPMNSRLDAFPLSGFPSHDVSFS